MNVKDRGELPLFYAVFPAAGRYGGGGEKIEIFSGDITKISYPRHGKNRKNH